MEHIALDNIINDINKSDSFSSTIFQLPKDYIIKLEMYEKIINSGAYSSLQKKFASQLIVFILVLLDIDNKYSESRNYFKVLINYSKQLENNLTQTETILKEQDVILNIENDKFINISRDFDKIANLESKLKTAHDAFNKPLLSFLDYYKN